MDPALIGGIFVSILFSAFFSGMEIAFIASDKLFIELNIEKNAFLKKYFLPLIHKPSLFLAITLVGNTVALFIYGGLMTQILDPYLQPYFDVTLVLILQTLISTVIVLGTAEFIPKSLFLINPSQTIISLAIPFRIISWFLYIPAVITEWISKFTITKLFKASYVTEDPVYKLKDLDNYVRSVVSESEDKSLDIEAEFLNNALEFKTIQVRECLIPRTDIIALPLESTIKDLKKTFIESGNSKTLIYKNSIDDIVGYCHSSMLFRKPKDIDEVLTTVDFVPETKLANELLVELISSRKSIAVVLDEFGGTSGIVTIEDIIEEIFGEIQDEHDDRGLVEVKIDDHNFLFSARHEIDYLNEKYDFKLPEGDYDTLGGLVLDTQEEIPQEADIIEKDQFLFTVKIMDGIKIERIKLTIRH